MALTYDQANRIIDDLPWQPHIPESYRDDIAYKIRAWHRSLAERDNPLYGILSVEPWNPNGLLFVTYETGLWNHRRYPSATPIEEILILTPPNTSHSHWDTPS